MFFRSLFALMVMAPWDARRGIDSITIKRPGIVMLRGGLAFIGGSCLYAAAALLPLAEVTAITFTRPIFASIAAALFLNEIIRFRRWTAIMLGLTGALIIIRPGFADVNVGVALTFVSVFTLTWNSVNLKLLTRINPPDTVAIWHMIVMLPLGLIACLFVWTPRPGNSTAGSPPSASLRC